MNDITRSFPYRTPNQNMRLIMKFVCSQQEPVGRTQIARAINRKVTPGLIEYLDTLVDWGYLIAEKQPHHTVGYMHRYSPGQQAYDDGWC